MYYILNGGDGGVLASSHVLASDFIEVYNFFKDNSIDSALDMWQGLFKMIPTFFKEPNPAPLKYCLYKMGLISSCELRSPLQEISDELKSELDQLMDY